MADRLLEQPADDVLVPRFQLVGTVGHDNQESGGPSGALLGGTSGDMADDLPGAGIGPVEILQYQCGRLVCRCTEQAARDTHVELQFPGRGLEIVIRCEKELVHARDAIKCGGQSNEGRCTVGVASTFQQPESAPPQPVAPFP